MARSGGHEPTGFAILAGPAVAAAGRVAETGLVIDLAPTLLHLAGAPIPGRLAGRSLID
jgi:arylsulfatase A-like enzyme